MSRRNEEAETEAEVGEDAENTMNKEDEKRGEQRLFVSKALVSMLAIWNEDLQGLTGKADDRQGLSPVTTLFSSEASVLNFVCFCTTQLSLLNHYLQRKEATLVNHGCCFAQGAGRG